MKIDSPAFANHEPIPQKHTCDGEDVSPKLNFSDVPDEAKSLVLIVDDPDAPMGTFDHWITWNIAPDTDGIEEGGAVPIQGKNHFNELRYRGPCPPPGPSHRYFFKLYAISKELELPEGATKQRVEEAMDGHILAKAEIIGTYQRGG